MRSRGMHVSAIAGWAALALAVARSAPAADVPAVHSEFGPNGLTSFKAGADEFLVKGDVALADLQVNNGPAINGEFDRTGPAFDVQKQTLENDYKWGKVRVVYRPSADRLALDIDITNTSRQPLTRMRLSLM